MSEIEEKANGKIQTDSDKVSEERSLIGQSINTSKKRKKLNFVLVILVIISTVFVVGLILALVVEGSVGNDILLYSGLVELAASFILYKVAITRERYICPECGTKREHHRQFLRTTNQIKKYLSNGQSVEKIIYTHHYLDTYVCTKCGETKEVEYSSSGGEFTEWDNGHIRDTRKAPQEF